MKTQIISISDRQSRSSKGMYVLGPLSKKKQIEKTKMILILIIGLILGFWFGSATFAFTWHLLGKR